MKFTEPEGQRWEKRNSCQEAKHAIERSWLLIDLVFITNVGLLQNQQTFDSVLSGRSSQATERSNGAKIDSKQNSPKAWWHTVSGDEIHQLLSNEASDNHLNNSNHCAFHQSAQYHKVIRYKPCEERGGVWEPFVPWPNLATPGFKQGTFDSSGFSARETPVSASTVPNCATELRKYVVRVSV